ncbi:MAG: hypothetical protein BroJett015_43040 [Chloroflexota bacterium]|nr:MAG: hypothetical protein BroJett015_43040 [Chloroflexota bacterium]
MRRAAEWLVAHMQALGLDKAQVMETAGYPVAYGERLGAGLPFAVFCTWLSCLLLDIILSFVTFICVCLPLVSRKKWR